MKLALTILVLAEAVAAGCSGKHQCRPTTTSDFLIDVSLAQATRAATRFGTHHRFVRAT